MGSIDYDLIAANPKVFIGFSDITAIHVALNQRLGLVTFHGPMIASNLGTEKWQRSEWAIASLRRAITLTNEPPGPLSQGDQTMMGRSLVEGVAEGTTIGGNLSLICGMLGTPVGLDDSPGRILLIEDVGETPYRADRALTQLRLAHKLSAVAGIAVGQFTELTAEEQTSMEEVFRDRLGDLGIPVVTGLPFGHEDPAGCIPLGAPARLEARSDGTGDLIITEPAVV
jgi:muramoyltetrapeptide carboxypeptidase